MREGSRFAPCRRHCRALDGEQQIDHRAGAPLVANSSPQLAGQAVENTPSQLPASGGYDIFLDSGTIVRDRYRIISPGERDADPDLSLVLPVEGVLQAVGDELRHD